MEKNVYLTKEQKELIILMAKERHNYLTELLEWVTRQDISDEDYRIIRGRFLLGLNEIDDLCRAVYRK